MNGDTIRECAPLDEGHATARALGFGLLSLLAAALFIAGVAHAGIDAAGTALIVVLVVAADAWLLLQLVREERARRTERTR